MAVLALCLRIFLIYYYFFFNSQTNRKCRFVCTVTTCSWIAGRFVCVWYYHLYFYRGDLNLLFSNTVMLRKKCPEWQENLILWVSMKSNAAVVWKACGPFKKMLSSKYSESTTHNFYVAYDSPRAHGDENVQVKIMSINKHLFSPLSPLETLFLFSLLHSI